ncbi:MAG TPA: carbohydrate kinase family protein [bacterium]|nr:carbohydrate kinase family protein [bacterium]
MASTPNRTRTGTLLFGAVSLDRYIHEGIVLPGGGVLNMAWHWLHAGFPFRLLSRVGDDMPELFGKFLDMHHIDHSAAPMFGSGMSASIDIVTREDRQPAMDNYVEGVWSGFRLDTAGVAAIAETRHLHAVLVDPVAAEIHRLGAAGTLAGAEVSADFLDFRHYDVERFAATMRHVDIGFVGWPHDADHSTVSDIRRVAFDMGRLVVLTLGARGILVFDGEKGRAMTVPVAAVPVRGTTVGCGDAFIAAFLAARWQRVRLEQTLELARKAGVEATEWRRPLPDEAYADLLLGVGGPDCR